MASKAGSQSQQKRRALRSTTCRRKLSLTSEQFGCLLVTHRSNNSSVDAVNQDRMRLLLFSDCTFCRDVLLEVVAVPSLEDRDVLPVTLEFPLRATINTSFKIN